jgi:hypothetical protein
MSERLVEMECVDVLLAKKVFVSSRDSAEYESQKRAAR